MECLKILFVKLESHKFAQSQYIVLSVVFQGMSEITQKQRNTSATVKKTSSKGSQDDDSSSSSGSDYWVQKVKAASHTQISGAITNFYSIQDLIEKGKFASVYSCVNKETGDSRAAKEMKKSEENEANNKLVLNEFKILKDLDHRNLNNVYGRSEVLI